MVSPQHFFHPRDQLTLVILAGLGFLGIAFFVWQQYRENGHVIDLDEATRYDNNFVVNINAADWPEIANLPGVGPKLAQEIVRYRNENGPYQGVVDLMSVPGIGPKKLEQIQSMLAEIRPNIISPEVRKKTP